MPLDKESLAHWLYRAYGEYVQIGNEYSVEWELLSDELRNNWLGDADDLASWLGLWAE